MTVTGGVLSPTNSRDGNLDFFFSLVYVETSSYFFHDMYREFSRLAMMSHESDSNAENGELLHIQKVFQDDSEGAKTDRFGETTKIIRLKIPSSLQKAMQISQKLNAQRLLAETSSNHQSNIKGQWNSTAKSSPLTESGYSSANSSCFSRESFETPSPASVPSQHQTARQIFDKSVVDLQKGKTSHTSPSVFTPSPISSLSSGLRNVAVFQASPSFSPNQNNAKSSLNLQRTSTPQSGYVVESADGQKFILPVDPQQTKKQSRVQIRIPYQYKATQYDSVHAKFKF
uniref:Uncharacterized protein n=1 Tax=Magallana gigas TaxID=29159 RepID=A0A8W8NGP0_MAGGI